MALQRDHRVPLINGALPDTEPWMRMDICNNAKIILPAVFPKCGMADGVKSDGSALVVVGIKIVIAFECRDSIGFVILLRQQKCAAFAMAVPALP